MNGEKHSGDTQTYHMWDKFLVLYKWFQEHVLARRNVLSTEENPKIVRNYTDDEVREGQGLGPTLHPVGQKCQVRPHGVIPKGNQMGKWWLIADLSLALVGEREWMHQSVAKLP